MTRRISSIGQIGLFLLLGLALAAPAVAQRFNNTDNENDAWQKIQDERNVPEQARLIEDFIKTYPDSPHRPDADFVLVNYYIQNKDNAKIMQHADSFRLTVPSADNAAKTRIFTQAMLAAANLRNAAKTSEYGGYVLQADPDNLTVLTFLAGIGLPNPKTAIEYAERAVGLPQPANVNAQQYQSVMAQMHGMLGQAAFSDKKFQEASDHFLIALKTNPKNHALQFQYGFASLNLATQAAQNAQKDNAELIKVMSATPTDPSAVAAAKAKVDEDSKEALAQRDLALDALANSLAIGGQYDKEAKQLFDNVYKNKTGSLDGEDEFLANKKTELGLNAPVSAPATAPATPPAK